MKVLKLVSLSLIFQKQFSAMAQSIDVLNSFHNSSWCKPDWCLPSMGKETNDLLKQCVQLPQVELSDNVDEIIRRSKEFPIPFPVETVRLQNLKQRKPIDKLKKNIQSTYPIIHERVLLLMTHFLIYKRVLGTSIEKKFYKDMTVAQLIDRILKKRAVVFMDSIDHYLLLNNKSGEGGWESVGSPQQRPPLVLEDCLSYDEMKLSSMVYVSGRTECINSGSRHNLAVVAEDEAETDAVIIGIVGPRFEREFRMEYEDILITERQNTLANGYGEEETPVTCLNVLKSTYIKNNMSAKNMWRQMWGEFYQVQSYTYEELTSKINVQEDPFGQFVRLHQGIFHNEVYFKRVAITAESTLLEAEARGASENRQTFVNIIGAGLGVWKISSHQNDVYVLTFLERIRALLQKDQLNHLSDVNFAYIRISDTVLALFSNGTSPDGQLTEKKKLLFESNKHPRGGISVWLENRDPSAKLTGEHEGKLLVMTSDRNSLMPLLAKLFRSLVMTYPWDGNAHPGNEFWLGSLAGSGDPAAACSTQVAELHNAHINPAVSGHNTRVVGRLGLASLQHYCAELLK